jgi:hypothetical protein
LISRAVKAFAASVFAIAILLSSLAVAAGAGARAPASLVRADDDVIVFRVEVPAPTFSPSGALAGTERLRIDGFDATGEPGEPAIPTRRFLVALPPQGAFTVSARVVGSRAVGTHRLEPVPRPHAILDEELGPVVGEEVVWDEAVYRGWKGIALVRAEEAAYIRRQRVVPLVVNPVTYNPVTYEVSVATVIEVEVRLEKARAQAAVEAPARPEAPGWDETFARLFVNARQAPAWRVPTTEPAGAPASTRVVPGAVKLKVHETGIHKVTAGALITAGFPAGQPVGGLRLFRRSYDETTFVPATQEVAFTVLEDAGGVAGTFEGNDLLVFYGRRLRDDPGQGDTYEQFSACNVYWFEPAAGTVMAERTPGVGFVSADTASASFTATQRFETDVWFFDEVPVGTPDVYYFNWGYDTAPVDFPFTVGTVKPGANLTLTAELLGRDYVSPRNVRVSLLNSQGEQTLNPAYAVPLKSRRTFSAAVPAAGLDVGTNHFRIDRPTGDTRTSIQVLLNWVGVSYASLYRARGNALRFNTATLAGDTSLTVTGISNTSNLELFDITDPIAPVRVVLGPGHFQPVAGGSALSFRETIPSRREFQLVPVSRMIALASSDIEADVPSSIIGGSAETGIDVLVVAHADYVSRMRSWASYRRAQGYRVLVVDVADVFDEFNGGVPSPQAVYRFSRHFFERGNASTLVLVGDASEDQKRVHADSEPNFVPTFLRVDAVPSLQDDEVVTTDKRLVKFPGPGGSIDPFPDMIVGRIPVGNTGELDIVLDKVYAYEKPSASDFWRKRMILVADDTYSAGGSTFGSFPLCDNAETGFESSQETCALIMENALPAGYDVVRFYLDDYTSAIHTTPCVNYFAAIKYTRQNATEVLLNELNQGATLVTIQAHMNRSLVAHEEVLATLDGAVLDGPGRDHLRVENRGKPWIIFGMGCHFSDYALHREADQTNVSENRPNGDSFAEQFLLQRDRGAVGTYGSSGFEYLFPNATYMERTTRVWFYEAPYDTMVNQTQAEWKFGELMFLVEAELAGGQRDPVERYHILGDPLLRIDAGPPNFDVTVDGNPFETGEVVEAGGEGDSIQVVAVVTDENAIRKFSLEVGGVDATGTLLVQPLTDFNLPRARQYRVSFAHKVKPENYDVVLRAFQAPDTLSGQYHIAAEFVLRVESSVSVAVNGRSIVSGASVPADGQYRIDLKFPVFIPGAEIGVYIDEIAVAPMNIMHPSPADTLSWVVTFRQELASGPHTMRVHAGTLEFIYKLAVSDDPGLQGVINYPNPFRSAGTSFVYSNTAEILDGTIDVFTVSGKRVRRVEIPPGARLPGQNAVFWDGRDGAGEAIANGTYLYVIRVNQRGGSATVRGSLSKLQ